MLLKIMSITQLDLSGLFFIWSLTLLLNIKNKQTWMVLHFLMNFHVNFYSICCSTLLKSYVWTQYNMRYSNSSNLLLFTPGSHVKAYLFSHSLRFILLLFNCFINFIYLCSCSVFFSSGAFSYNFYCCTFPTG